MKFLLLLFSICLISGSKGQLSSLAGEYISQKQDRFALNKDTRGIMFENSAMYHLYFDRMIEVKDTLKLYLLPEAIIKDKEYIFKLLKCPDSFFIIKPISRSAMKLFNNRKEIKFIKQEFLYDSTVQLEKIVFIAYIIPRVTTTGVALQIDSNKDVIFKLTTRAATLETKDYKGKLTEKAMLN